MAELRYVDWDGLVYYDGKIKTYIQDNAEEYIKMGGIVPFEDLPNPSWQNLNYIYKVTTEFVSTRWFEHPGILYKSGTWVQVVDFDEVYKYVIFNEDIIGNTADIDLTNYYTKSEVNTKMQEMFASIDDSIDNIQAELNYKASISDIENKYVSNTYITENYITNEQIASTYVTQEKVTEVVTHEVNTVVTDKIETTITEVIQEKVDTGEIAVAVDKINYGDFEDDINTDEVYNGI